MDLAGARRRWLAGILWVTAGCASMPCGALAQSPLRREVLDNLKSQPLGPGNVASLNLPDEFLRHLADRILIESYQQNFRAVDGAPADSSPGSPPSPDALHDLPAWCAAPVAPPPLRGFRAEPDPPPSPWPVSLAADATSEQSAAAAHIAARLARDGLLATTLAALRLLDVDETAADHDLLHTLRDVGLPIDLLAAFAPPSAAVDDDWRRAAEQTLAALRALMRAAQPADALARKLSDWRFDFRAATPRFQVAPESGTPALAAIRAQAPPRRAGPPAGGAFPDLLQTVLAAAPDAAATIHVRDSADDGFARVLNRRRGEAPPPRVLAQLLPLTQWAQDNGKAGWLAQDGARRIATLVPRYANRRDDVSEFLPGDQLALRNLPHAEIATTQSALLFQGGNVYAIRDTAKDETVLLVGEAELYRNIALGLTRAQVVAAFAVEFGVDRVVILPGVAFHIDLELTARDDDGRVRIFVNDVLTAAREIVRAGVGALERADQLERAQAAAAEAALTASDAHSLAGLLGAVLQRHVAGPGRFTAELAAHFAAGPDDSGPANLQRFIIALDHLLFTSVNPTQLAGDPPTQAYAEALQAEAARRRVLHAALAAEGWEVATVPSFAAGPYSVNYLNGIHDRTRFFMPVYGGLFAGLDELAKQTLSAHWGAEVRILPIPSAASQRRGGGVHCSISAYYHSPQP